MATNRWKYREWQNKLGGIENSAPFLFRYAVRLRSVMAVLDAGQVITSVFPLLFIIGSIVALALTGNLLSSSPFVIAVQAAAVGLSFWARRSFRQGTFRVTAVPAGSSIIREGPYRVIRHPMYAAALVFVWAAVASHASGFTLVLGVACTGVAVARVFVEERLLRARFVEYPAYARSTNALLPFVF